MNFAQIKVVRKGVRFYLNHALFIIHVNYNYILVLNFILELLIIIYKAPTFLKLSIIIKLLILDVQFRNLFYI